jgi:glycosyltransferase involved in cell wall biosynthesis
MVFRVPVVVNTAVLGLLRGTDRPFGVEVLGDPRSSLGSMRHSLRRLFQWYYARDLRRRCQEAFASAYVTQDVLQKMYPPHPNRFSTSYSDVQVRTSDVLPHPRQTFPQDRRYRLVMVGTLSQMYKGHDVLLKALALLPGNLDYELAIVGSGTFRPAIERLAETLGLRDRAHFLGEIPPGDGVRAELDRSDLFVMPSITEGLPRAMIEAMARGLPCIGSKVGGIPELLPPEAMVPPKDPVQLSVKLAEVLADPARMQKMSEYSLQVAARYTECLLSSRRREFYEHLRRGTEIWLKAQRSYPVDSASSLTAKLS